MDQRKMLFKTFCLIFFPTAVVISLVGWTVYSTNVESNLKIIKTHDDSMVELQKESIANDVSLVISDLIFLSRQIELLEALAQKPDKHDDWPHLAMDYLAFSAAKKIYDQVRFIDVDGMEKIRIDYNGGKPAAVDEHELQQKGHRYYFQEAIKLSDHEIFVSPLDLNVEHGEVEKPFRPMIRFATPVFDFEGNKRGVIVLNYLGAKLIDHFVRIHTDHPNRSHLLNADGYWLHGGSDESEWSFMFPEREQKSFSLAFPEEWRQIDAGEEGQFRTANGLFTFVTLYPLPKENMVAIYPREYHWKIVSIVPEDEIAASGRAVSTGVRHVVFLTLFLLSVGSWLLAKARAQHRLDLISLRNSEAGLNEAQRLSGVGSWELDLITGRLQWSDEIYRIFEIDPKQFGASYEAFLDVIHPDDRVRVDKAYVDSLENKSPYDIEHRLLMKDGRVKWVREHCHSYFNDNGKPVRSIGAIQDITESVEAENVMLAANKKLKEMASTDPLTNVLNRRFFMLQTTREFQRFKRYGGEMAILFIDADNFKEVNDKYGHAAGDQALVSFVEVLRAELRNVDVIGRTGGDEFAVLLPATGEHHAMEVAARICLRVGSSLAFTVSIGVSTPSSEIDSIETLINDADKAMYKAKERGRNQVVSLGNSS